MAKIKKSRLLLSMAVIIGVSVLVIGSLDQDKEINFKLPLPLSVTQTQIDACNNQADDPNICNPFIWGAWAVQTDIIDSNGNVIAVENSPFLAGNPVTTFDLSDTATGKSFGGFIVKPHVKLSTSSQEIFNDPYGLFTPFDVNVNIDSADLIVKVYSQDADGNLIETWNGVLTTKDLKFTNPQSQSLGEITINADDLLKYLPEGQYKSWNRVVVGGTLLIHYDGYPTVKYALTSTIEEVHKNGELVDVKNQLINYRQINVDKQGTTEVIPTGDCPTGEIFHEGVCVKNTSGDNGQVVIQENGLGACLLQNPDKSCFFSSDSMVIILVIIILIAVAFYAYKKTRKQVYGM